jgi:gamma-butyrobetaine dioxygenase
MTTVELIDDGRRVLVDLPGGETRDISARWLFDHALEARDPASGQRLHGAFEIEDAATAARIDGGDLVLTFMAGDRRVPLSSLTLAPAPPLELWPTPDLIAAIPPIPFDAYMTDDLALARALGRVALQGLVFLSGAGDDPQAVERAVARFGFIRETNYGRLFDVRAEAEPKNIAFTERALELHADNPYREPVPTMQVLHAITVEDEGGETVFVDGFAQAEVLRDEAPAACAILAREPARFTFTEASGARWSAEYPVLEFDADGALRAVRLNHRSLDLPPLDAGPQDAWYGAYLTFYRLVHMPSAAYVKRLAPGEMVIFDNRRILHGRRAFSRGGARWLRGCYADIDGLHATLARLRAVPRAPANSRTTPAEG